MGDNGLYTGSSKPKNSPNQIDKTIKDRIINLRIETKRCTEAKHLMLQKENIEVSRNTVHRVLDRAMLLKKRSPGKDLILM